MSSSGEGSGKRVWHRSGTLKLLEETSKREGIKDTAHLVRVYNRAAEKESPDRDYLQKWLFKYIEWFKTSTDVFESFIVEEYLILLHVQPNDHGGKRLLRNLFLSLGRCAAKQTMGDRSIVDAVYCALCVLDPVILQAEEDTSNLLFLAVNLLDRLKGPQALTKITYAAYSPVLSAVYEIVRTLETLAPNLLNKTNPEGLYQDFRKRLELIKGQNDYYPFHFQIALIEQALGRIAYDDADFASRNASRRLYSGLTGALFLCRGLKSFLTGGFDIDSCESGVRRIAEAVKQSQIPQESWYDCLQVLNHSSLLATSDNSKLEIFKEAVEYAHELLRKLSVRGNQWKQLLYGMLMCTRNLLKTTAISKEIVDWCVEELEEVGRRAVGKNEDWGTDPDIVVCLLDSLVDAHARLEDGDCRRESLNDLLVWMTKFDEGGMLLALDCDDKCNRAIKAAIDAWFDQENVNDKLDKKESTNPDEPSSDSLFDIVKQKMGITHSSEDDVVKNMSELRRKYQSVQFTQVRPFLAKAFTKHVQDFQYSLVRCEESGETMYFMNEEGQLEQDQVGTNFDRQSKNNPNITLDEIFSQPRIQTNQKVKEISTVLVYGNPGTGKTTISKRIAYEWATGKWMPELSAVYWIPIRKVTNKFYDNSGPRRQRKLETAIATLCFEYKEGTDFYVLYEQITVALSEPSTLIILDGVDEADETGRDLIKNAFERRCKVLLFSRPYELHGELKQVNVEIECVGLNDVQLEEFVKSEMVKRESVDLLQFLRKSVSLWKLAHVPVTLNILCFVWKERRAELTTGSVGKGLTSVYNEMTMYLWQRYSEECSDCASRDDAFIILERAAFAGLRNGQILIQQNIVERYSTTVLLKRNIRDSGFLLLQVTSTTQYQFPHLTFQEYFAGSYLARTLRSRQDNVDRERTEQFISDVKYQSKHKLTFTFLAQKLGQEDGVKGFGAMLNLVDKEPLEIIGVQQIFLRLRILDDFLSSSEHLLWNSYRNDKNAAKLVEIMFLLLRTFRGIPSLLEMTINRVEHLSSLIHFASHRMAPWLQDVKETGPKSKKELELIEKFAKHHNLRANVVEEMRTSWRRCRAERMRVETSRETEMSRRGTLNDLLRSYAEKRDQKVISLISEKLLETAVTLKEQPGGQSVTVLAHSAQTSAEYPQYLLKTMQPLLKDIEQELYNRFANVLDIPEIGAHKSHRSKWANMDLSSVDRMPSHLLLDGTCQQYTNEQEERLSRLKKGKPFIDQYTITDEVENEKAFIRFAEQTFSGEEVVLKFYKSVTRYKHAKQCYSLVEGSESVCRMVAAQECAENFPPFIALQKGSSTLPEWMEASVRTRHELKNALTEILTAIAEVHRQDLVHGNIKPENIMIFPNFKWKLINLDYALLTDTELRDRPVDMYMAPEVITALKNRDTEFSANTAADMWSFGLIVYEVLQGKKFYDSKVKPEDIPKMCKKSNTMPGTGISKENQASKLIAEILQYDPDKRLTAAAASESPYFQNPDHTIQIRPKTEGTEKISDELKRKIKEQTSQDQYTRYTDHVEGRKHLAYGTGVNSGDKVVIRYYRSLEDYNESKRRHRTFATSDHICRKLLSKDPSGAERAYNVFQAGVFTLSAWAKRANHSFSEKKNALLQILTGLVGIHDENFVHCRINPEKVMIFPDFKWKFLDVSSFVKEGTFWRIDVDEMYAAPEIIKALHEGKVSIEVARSMDMWSFGVIAYEVFTGQRFYGGDAARETPRHCLQSGKWMPDLKAIEQKQTRHLLRKLLVLDPVERRTAASASNSSCFQVVESTTQVTSTTTRKPTSNIFRNVMPSEVVHANLAISFSLERFCSSDDVSDDLDKRKGADVTVWRDKYLPDDPVFVLPVKEDFRLRIVVSQEQTRNCIASISSVKVALPHKRQYSLPFMSVHGDPSRLEAVALLKPSTLDERLLKPAENSSEMHERYWRLDLTVYVKVADATASREKIRHKIYCTMVNPDPIPIGTHFERTYTEAWERYPEWKALGQKNSVLLVQVLN